MPGAIIGAEGVEITRDGMEIDLPVLLIFFFFFVVLFVPLFPFRGDDGGVDGCEGDDVEGRSALLALDNGRRGPPGLSLDDGGRSPRLWWWGGL